MQRSHYDLMTEYERLGLHGKESRWRITNANADFSLCKTYPPYDIILIFCKYYSPFPNSESIAHLLPN